ncbi:helix-turn-helix domain-containing protein [Aureivirga marina]|uniref:helix-turn-helix domain-containing protein n=1 Tax=Aureivirga marina TaxID=1182451 RepID=UPI0018CB1847|nr:AraC family transcriptional regulator [Aureivirga marina]
MKVQQGKYKNIDKSSCFLLDDSEKFSVLSLENDTNEVKHYQYVLPKSCLQLYFCLHQESKIAFQMEHCQIKLEPKESGMVYFEQENMPLLFELQPNSQIITILISVNYLHSLFSSEQNYIINFDDFKSGKPIIETKATNPLIQTVLHQLCITKMDGTLHSLYVKGKIYELLSLYFNSAEESDIERCPFMANEETVAQIKRAKDIIIENMANPPSLEELSKMVGLNIKKLKMGFKEFYGLPVFTFLLNYKMEHSKKLLSESNMNVNEIALQVGYSTSSHFIAAFKKKFGITPKQFMKQD